MLSPKHGVIRRVLKNYPGCPFNSVEIHYPVSNHGFLLVFLLFVM